MEEFNRKKHKNAEKTNNYKTGDKTMAYNEKWNGILVPQYVPRTIVGKSN